ncbi:MAG: 50S ribosomal protein L10 [Candidatus Zixiibacteriota bacterium]|jgi:large subunit ribosomal protein L10
MPISKERKEEILALLKSEFGEAEGAVFTDFRGVDVAGMTRLRSTLRAEGSRYFVAKRTLAEIALSDEDKETLGALLDGATGIAFVGEEPVAVAKILVDFRKDYAAFVIKGGLLGGEFLASEKIVRLAKTPPRDVLLAMLFAAMKSPQTSLVYVMSGVMRKAVATLAAIADKKKEEENT